MRDEPSDEKVREEILDAVAFHGPLEQEELYDVISVSKSDTRTVIWTLVNEGLLEFTETYGVKPGSNFSEYEPSKPVRHRLMRWFDRALRGREGE